MPTIKLDETWPEALEILERVMDLTGHGMPDGLPPRRALEAWVASQVLLIQELRETNALLGEFVRLQALHVVAQEEESGETPNDRAMVPCRGCGHRLGSHRAEGCQLCDCPATP